MAAARLSVGIIAPPWLPVPPKGYGGTEAFLDTLARGLKSAGHEVVLFTTGDARPEVRRRSSFRRALGVGAGGAVHESRQAIEAYESLAGMDIIQDQTFVGPLYALSLRRLVVTTSHGPFDDNTTPLFRALGDRVAVVAVSHHQASTASGWHPAAVIHHGLDLERFPVGRGDGGYAAFLGRMHPDKGVDMAARLARSVGLPLKIAATIRDGFEHDYFASVVQPLLGGDIEYVGEVGPSEKVELLGGAICLLNPIRWPEPFGLAMLEALACGTPVVASARGSVTEIVDDKVTGFCCRGERSLARALSNVGKLERARCREAAEARFSADRMVRQYVSLYERLLASGRVPLLNPETAA